MTPKTQASDFPNRDPDLFYELARDRLAMQLEAVDALDNKIAMLVSLASGLLGILAAIFALRARPLDASDIALITVSTAAYLTASVLGIRAYFCRSWKLGPNLDGVWAALWRKDNDDALVKWQVATSMKGYYEANRSGQEMKERALPYMLIAVVTQSLLLVLALFLVAEGA